MKPPMNHTMIIANAISVVIGDPASPVIILASLLNESFMPLPPFDNIRRHRQADLRVIHRRDAESAEDESIIMVLCALRVSAVETVPLRPAVTAQSRTRSPGG